MNTPTTLTSILRRPPQVRTWLSVGAWVPTLLLLAAWATPVPLSAASTSRVDQVVIVFKTHFDIGYTDLASNVVQRYRTTMMDDALRVVDRNRTLPPARQFVWTLPGWPMSKIAGDWPGQTVERQGRIKQALRDGRFAVHALPFTTHTELLEPEELVRGMGYASRLSRELSLELPRDAKMTDVPSHSWILPTLLRHAGVDFLHLGCNAASRSPKVPTLFWWEGPDGSRLLTMYTAESYGTGLVPPADWGHRTWLALIHTGDNHGPPTPEEVDQLLGDAQTKLPGVKVRIGRLSDFSDALLAEKPQLPVVRGDMPDTWIHGPMSDPAGAALARTMRPRIASMEALNACLGIWGTPTPPLGRAVASLYESSLLYGEHTWGGALSWVFRYEGGDSYAYGDAWKQQRAAGKFARLEASWEEHSAYIRRVAEELPPLAEQLTDNLATAVNVEGPRIVVFNPLPWKRDGWVVARGHGEAALSATDYREVVATEPAGDNGEIFFVARDLPPMGYRTYVPTDDEPPAASDLAADDATASIENAYYRVEFDAARACLRSVFDKRNRRELVETNAPHGFGQFLYERFSSNQVAAFVKDYVKIDASWATNELGKPSLPPDAQVPYRAAAPRNATLSLHQGPAGIEVSMESAPSDEIPFTVVTSVRLESNQPYVHVGIELVGKPADPWPEAGWLCLPFAVDTPRFRLARPGGLVDPAKDLVAGANHNLFALDGGLLLSDPRSWNVGFCAAEAPLVSLDEPGCWKYAPAFVPRKPRAYVNLFNNQWTTNFRLWNEGTWRCMVRIWSAQGGDAAAELVRSSWETRTPLEAGTADGPVGPLPNRQAGVSLSQPGVLLTAFGPNPDGAGLLLRLWEAAGRAGRCSVRLPGTDRFQSAQPVDLRGRPAGKALPVTGGSFVTDLKAYAPATFLLQARNDTSGTKTRTAALRQRIREDRRLDDVLSRALTLLKTGFNAGSGYREVWIRDCATFLEMSCKVRPRAEIKENLRLFFQLQGDDGNVIDGFVHKSQANVGYNYIKKDSVPDYWGHKNTVETDQESSLVQAVHTYVRVTRDTGFLDEVIDGKTVLQRLELALEFLTQHRWSKPHGLLWGATTVDWGDVQPEHEWGVELDASSHRALDIYDNAMFLVALRDYLELAGKDHASAARWAQVRDQVQANVRKHLWDTERRKFIPHVYLEGSPFAADLDERSILYLGGTAIAIHAGLLSDDEIRESLEQMRAAVKAAGAGSIGLTVYPPYPEGAFKNRSMGPWSYQNGGDWDWFGGRMIQTLIEHGLVEEAYTELSPMLDRVIASNGFYEWWDRQNKPKGSGTFRGAAGVLGKAIVQLQAWAGEPGH